MLNVLTPTLLFTARQLFLTTLPGTWYLREMCAGLWPAIWDRIQIHANELVSKNVASASWRKPPSGAKLSRVRRATDTDTGV
jgi:hypothetical protein